MSGRVVVLEDDPIVRRGVVEQIAASERFSVAAEAGDVVAARRAIETTSAVVGVFDLELRDGSALPLIPVALARGMSVLVLTIWDDDERVYQALASGAGGYLLKGDAAAGRVAEALGVLVDGGAPISPTIARRLLDDIRLRAPKKPEREPTPDLEVLTGREREIIELFAKGATYEEVATLLTLSVNTVRHHVRSMYRKLHVCSKTEAVTLAFPRP
ncbi:MAG: response regulator transcription factor [Labilithrix sp.]|nr:response regulator transcription factor [Labilithrix sp.]MBX3224023.1 response regulator transcription factor [Labilithrix sp.]